MFNRSIVIAVILIAVLTPMFALIAANNAQYTSPITMIDDKPMIDTANGTVEYKDVEYLKSVVAVKAFGVAVKADMPIMLPNTSSPNGTVTCMITDANGNSFTVTRATCADL